MTENAEKNRYAKDWDTYSESWTEEYGDKYAHLGDEWNDDKSDERKRDEFYFRIFAERWLDSKSTVLEVGPGSGKWTVRMAPHVAKLIAVDVSEEMLGRTEKRCKENDITNVEFVLLDGQGIQPVADASVDFFFSYDVFVHIALEDSFPYAHEMARILKPGGKGVCHYAVNSVPEAWDRVEQNNSWYQGGKNTIGQFYYHSPETIRRMYERCGLRIFEMFQEWAFATVTFEKPKVDIVTRLETILWDLSNPVTADPAKRDQCCDELESLPKKLIESIQPLIDEIRESDDQFGRGHSISKLRRAWRGF